MKSANIIRWTSIRQVPDELLIGTLLWNKLSKQEQQWVKEAAVASRVYEKKIWHEAEIEALTKIKEAGVQIIEPDKEAFRERVQPLYQTYKENPEMKKLIEEIQAVE